MASFDRLVPFPPDLHSSPLERPAFYHSYPIALHTLGAGCDRGNLQAIPSRFVGNLGNLVVSRNHHSYLWLVG